MRGCGKKNIILHPLLITYKYLATGDHVFVRDAARIEGISTYLSHKYDPKIVLGNKVSIEQNLHLTCANSISIGNNTAIAANVTITDITHPYTDISLPPEQQPIEVSSVVIGEDCKIYNNAVILPGTILGKHNVVGANSVVGGVFPDYCVIAGAPAKIIKYYNPATKNWEKAKPSVV